MSHVGNDQLIELARDEIDDSTCVECGGNDLEDGPVPDAEDRKYWIDKSGDEIECPQCRLLGYTDEDGTHLFWSIQREGESVYRECGACRGTGRFTMLDRCCGCGRIEDQFGKGPDKVSEEDRIFDRYHDFRL